jgi:F-type H+-transporting ATPase subunit epsilon
MNGSLDVHGVTPELEVWSGPAETVIARGVDGEVGILTGHAPMMVQLAIGPLRIHREGDGELAAVIDGGFMHVTSAGGEEGGERGTRVDVLAAHAELAGDIDVDAAMARAAELEERLQNHDTQLAEADVAAIRGELKKALARIALATVGS